MLISSTANENASRTTCSSKCHYRQEALDESIGVCTNNLAVNIYTSKAKVLLLRQSFITSQGMLNVFLWLDRYY